MIFNVTVNSPQKKLVQEVTKKIWWKCQVAEDHRWHASPNQRKSDNCPFCIGQRTSLSNSLASHFPEIAKEWHPEKNGGVTPDSIFKTSNKKVWWKCEVAFDHIYEMSVANKTGGKGCPFCAGKRASKTNSLISLFPDVSKQWDYKRNQNINIKEIIADSHKSVWWICECGFKYETAVIKRTKFSKGCPKCQKK